MFFLLKKWIAFFFQPLTITFILLGIGLYFLCKKEANIKRARQFLIGGTVFLFLMSWSTFTYFLAAPFEQKYEAVKTPDKSIDYKFIHSLGSGHADNDKLPANSRMGYQALSRVIEAVRLHKIFPNTKIVFSGYGGSSKESAAKVSSDVAISLGVDKENIILIEDAKDTIDESKSAFEIIGEEPFFLVSSASHLTRSVGLFTKLGMNPTPAPTDYTNKGKCKLGKPDSYGLYRSERAIYEALGITWAWLTGRL